VKIGKLVKYYIPRIVAYCTEHNPNELENLQKKEYSKKSFGVNWPFLSPTGEIEDSSRFWVDEYRIEQKLFRVTSQWYERNRDLFTKYLIDKGIATAEEIANLDIEVFRAEDELIEKRLMANKRYKSSAIGNAQNLLIRNILSNIGDESFTRQDWEETKRFFEYRCAYCGEKERKLIMEHAVPINRLNLGEHKLGNLVPSCEACNQMKSSQRYDEFLGDKTDRVKKIEEYMVLRGYKPLYLNENADMIEEILDIAYKDVAEVSKRYIKIIESIHEAV